jgi:hypothetical protein
MKTTDKLTLASFLLLIMVIGTLLLQLSKAWRNERFLDAELNKLRSTPTHQTK